MSKGLADGPAENKSLSGAIYVMQKSQYHYLDSMEKQTNGM
jgi:hypothetical protein